MFHRLGKLLLRALVFLCQRWWAKVRGREDPGLRIGVDQRLVGQTFWALNGIDLTIHQGEAVGIIGSNGADKSTLLKLLSRITAPTEGEIDIYGRISSMLEVGTGFHGQMTGRENVYLNGAILGMTRGEIDQKMEQIIDFSEVREFIDTPVKRYSSGMFVKLAFSVAAHLNSEILIMDEVLAVGDMAFQEKCLKRMRQAALEEGRTVLYVSHNMNTIRSLCDRCVVLDKGRLIFDGDVEEAISVYMNRGIEENEVDLDLADRTHSVRNPDTGLRMLRVRLEDRTVPVYDTSEDLRLRFRLRITRPLDRVQLRITFHTATDQPVGTAWAEPTDFPETGEAEAVYRFPLNALSRGVLYASIGFCRMNDGGGMVRLDHVDHAFKVDLTTRIGYRYWNAQTYGAVRLPEIVREG